MSTNYIYGGPAANLGRFGTVTPGQILALTDAEVANVSGDVDFAPLPTAQSRTIFEKVTAYALLDGDSGKLLRTKQTAGVTFTLPTAPDVGDNYELQDASDAGASVNNITLTPGATNVISGLEKSFASIAVSAAGTGFTSRPTVTTGGAGGTGATATLSLKAVAVAIAGGGTGYAANDVLTVVGGTGTAATLTVTAVDGSGVITALSVATGGVYTALPANSVAVTGGTGTGGTFNLTWGVAAATVTAEGTGYTTGTAVVVGGGGTGATLAVTLAPNTKVISVDAALYGVYWNGAKWMPY